MIVPAIMDMQPTLQRFFPPNVVEQCFFSSVCPILGQTLEGKKEKGRLYHVCENNVIDPSQL